MMKRGIALLLLIACSPLAWHSVERSRELGRQLAYIEARNSGYDDVGQRLSMRFGTQRRGSSDGLTRMRLQRSQGTWNLLALFSILTMAVSALYLAWPVFQALGQVLGLDRRRGERTKRTAVDRKRVE